ncbi:MAG: DUF1926 domain-containing protein [Ferrovum sp.]|nr:DUF1926 domain-containing protein [Ferrovum sp.]
MSKKIALLLGVHAHQPVGNFPAVMEDAHHRCYRPFLHLLAQFPEFPCSVHFSGWLLDYLIEHHRDDMELLKTMVVRGQVELFTAGYAEPVLAAIPEVDRVGQIRFLSERIQEFFGGDLPRGSWLTERVWESSVVPSLRQSGVRYVTVDDYHFLCAGQDSATLQGYFTTEEGGEPLDIFPIAESLRYKIPFTPASEVVSYIESLAKENKLDAGIYFDDIEKFGIWPETYEWVYEKGWFEQFIRGVLSSDIISPMTFAQYHAQSHTRGPVYLPTTSYIEMNEWTLPASAARRFSAMVERSRWENRYTEDRPFIRGGIWRNFMMRYPEANHLHKRMLGLSQRFHALDVAAQTAERRRLLYESQANDAYWHGLFGGLYLPHLRRALYAALIELERDLDTIAPRPPQERRDFNLDGYDETLIHNELLQVIVAGSGPAHVLELDSYQLRQNFADTLTRQAEHYHDKMTQQPTLPQESSGLANPHDRVAFKDVIGPEDMTVDSVRRALFTDYVTAAPIHAPLEYVPESAMSDTSLTASFHCQTLNWAGMIKSFSLLSQALLVTYTPGPTTSSLNGLAVELNLVMPSCDGPAGRFENNGKILGGFGDVLTLESVSQLMLRDEVLRGQVTLGCNVSCRIQTRPCYSVSQSEAGFEKILQSVTVTLDAFAVNEQEPLILSLAIIPL